jgi:ABC-2 type transport system ATP-binding protein
MGSRGSSDPVTSAALEVSGLTKRFGDVLALDGIDLTVEEGGIYGFLGPNGAGKTTTLRILTGLARADSGTARLLGHAPGSAEAREATGFLPDVPGFYPWMRAEEFLHFAGGLFGLSRTVLDERVPLLLDLAGLSGVRSRIGGFSRGMRQRLGIAQALVNAPRLLMLDEPTSALDPLGRKEVLDMIASLAGRTTVFFSTHILADVERVCDAVAILDRGKVVAESPIGELKRAYAAHRLTVGLADGVDRLASALSGAAWVSSLELVDDSTLSIAATDLDAARREVPRAVADLGLALERLESGEVSLEDVFVELVGGGGR